MLALYCFFNDVGDAHFLKTKMQGRRLYILLAAASGLPDLAAAAQCKKAAVQISCSFTISYAYEDFAGLGLGRVSV
jgi:hypothetical protein